MARLSHYCVANSQVVEAPKVPIAVRRDDRVTLFTRVGATGEVPRAGYELGFLHSFHDDLIEAQGRDQEPANRRAADRRPRRWRA